MALRTAHGAAAGRGLPGPRVEVLPADELPPPVAAVVVAARPAVGGRRSTTFQPGDERARRAGHAGGLARQAVRGGMPLATVGTGTLDHEAFAPYRRKAAGLRRAYCAELAVLAGGMCGAGPSAMVAAGATEYAASRFILDQAAKTLSRDDFALAAKLSGAARQHFLAAYELAVRQAQLRGLGDKVPDADAVMRAAEERTAARRARAPVMVEG